VCPEDVAHGISDRVLNLNGLLLVHVSPFQELSQRPNQANRISGPEPREAGLRVGEPHMALPSSLPQLPAHTTRPSPCLLRFHDPTLSAQTVHLLLCSRPW
jgi:hypothetical protein